MRDGGTVPIRRGSTAGTTCPACHQVVQSALHARRGTTVYLNQTAYPPFSTADLHSQHCPQPNRLRQHMQHDQHAAFTGAKWRT